MKQPNIVEIYGREQQAKVGSYVIPDGWNVGDVLLKGDEPVDASYQGSQFRVLTRQPVIPSLPVNVELTGRTLQRRGGLLMIRCQIEFVKDGEPSEFVSGWMQAA